MAGFEPATRCFQGTYADQTALHPYKISRFIRTPANGPYLYSSLVSCMANDTTRTQVLYVSRCITREMVANRGLAPRHPACKTGALAV